MTNEELKKKICDIIALYVSAYGDDERIADALIAAKIGDVKDLQAQVDVLEITNIALQAGYDDAEKDRLYWVDKYKEAEHRAARAERALMTICTNVIKDEEDDLAIEPRARVLHKAYIQQAEKELAEEEKE